MAKQTDEQVVKRSRSRWKQDPAAVQSDILAVATEVFARDGLSGARVEEIAARTNTSKRMLYYYFDNKETLYCRTLEAAYRIVREGERQLQLDGLDPQAALSKLVEFTFDHHRSHPDFIRLVMIENIHHGDHLAASRTIRELNRGAILRLEGILDRGIEAGLFRSDLDALKVHWQISALSFFNVSNQTTFSLLFGKRLSRTSGQSELRQWVVESVLRSVLPSDRITG